MACKPPVLTRLQCWNTSHPRTLDKIPSWRASYRFDGDQRIVVCTLHHIMRDWPFLKYLPSSLYFSIIQVSLFLKPALMMQVRYPTLLGDYGENLNLFQLFLLIFITTVPIAKSWIADMVS